MNKLINPPGQDTWYSADAVLQEAVDMYCDRHPHLEEIRHHRRDFLLNASRLTAPAEMSGMMLLKLMWA